MAEPDLDFANWRVAEEAMDTGKLEYPPVKFEPQEVIRVPDAHNRVASDYIPRTKNFVEPLRTYVPQQTKTFVAPVAPPVAGPQSTFPKFDAPKSLHVPFKTPELASEIVKVVTPVTTFDWGHAIANMVGSIASFGSLASYAPSVLGTLAGGLGIMNLVSNLTGGQRKQPRQRQAGAWIYFSVPWIKSAPFVKFLEDQQIVIDNVHQVEDRCYIAVAAYHVGKFKREADKYKIEYKQVS